jgi:hypothetical protein
MFSNILGGAAGFPVADLGDTVSQSLRFRGSQNLTKTMVAGAQTTFSCWVKIANLSQTSAMTFIGATSGTNYLQFYWEGATYETLGADNSNTSFAFTSNKLRDPSAWYHLVYVRTSSDTKVYINGAEASYRTSGTGSNGALSSTTFAIGSYANGTGKFEGYMADVHFVESVKQPSDFGRYQEDGVWVPKNYTGTYGTNGFHLTFDSSQTNGIGHDSSGNGNHFTASGFDTAAISSSNFDNDVDYLDTPTSNYATLNPLALTSDYGLTSAASYEPAILSDANLKSTGVSAKYSFATPTILVPDDSTETFYFETRINAIVASDPNIVVRFYDGSNNYQVFINNAGTVSSSSSLGVSGTGPSFNSVGDVVGLQLNMSSNTIRYQVNGGTVSSDFTFNDLGLPAALSHNHYNTNVSVNFGQYPFLYQPTGTVALQTNNLPEPTIKNGREHFDVLTWTGDGASPKTRTGLEFTPDLVWIKERNQAFSIGHRLYDSVRGAGVNKHLDPSTYQQEGYGNDEDYGYVTGFVDGGFTTQAGTTGDDYVNDTSTNYVAWCWSAPEAWSSTDSDITAGTIASSGRRNKDAGFSITSYQGNLQPGATVAHGLSTTPEFMIHKSLNLSSSGASPYWSCWHVGTGNSNSYLLDENWNAAFNAYNGGSPNANHFVLGPVGITNSSGKDFIAYCWHSVEGYSKFGSYEGNSSPDGPFVYTGHKTAFLIIKNADAAANWMMLDTSRQSFNPNSAVIYANQNTAEYTGTGFPVDFLSNGFKIRVNDPNLNTSGQTYVYMSFAENPFGGENAAPATAR